jgi:hypothetical protein
MGTNDPRLILLWTAVETEKPVLPAAAHLQSSLSLAAGRRRQSIAETTESEAVDGYTCLIGEQVKKAI